MKLRQQVHTRRSSSSSAKAPLQWEFVDHFHRRRFWRHLLTINLTGQIKGDLDLERKFSVTMETPEEQKEPTNGQLISVNRKDTCRLLEVFVKRSLSLNDGNYDPPKRSSKHPSKWVKIPERSPRVRRHSSDPSLHLAADPDDYSRVPTSSPYLASPDVRVFLSEAEEDEEEEARPVVAVSKKNKKSSMWKSFLGFFSKKWGEETDERTQQEEQAEVTVNCLPLPTGMGQKNKSRRRSRMSRRQHSFRRSFKRSSRIDITGVEAMVSVEPTYSYFEKVSEEMELIVQQVQEQEKEKVMSDEEVINRITALTKEQGNAIDEKLKDDPTLCGPYLKELSQGMGLIVQQVQEQEKVMSDEEVINRIIALTKEQGNIIDEKLKDNPTLSNFFNGMSYSAFQKLADNYLEAETTPVQNQAPSLLPAPAPAPAPELVRLAFTLDFTARVARLSRQNVGRITCLGNRYLEDRFEYKQACTDHPWSDSDEG